MTCVVSKPDVSDLTAAFVGLGAMGAPMAGHWALRGYLKAVWNRTPERAEAFAQEHKVMALQHLQELPSKAKILALCVSRDDDVLMVLETLLEGLTSEHLVIDFSTISPDTSKRAAKRVRGCGADFLDAPVTGGVEGASNATLAIMVGGRLESLEKIRPLLDTIATKIVHMGDVGRGQSTKAVNQVLCAGINEAVTEALAFGHHLGLDMEQVIEAISGGAAGNWFLDKRGKSMIEGRFSPGFKLALHLKDLEIVAALAQDLEITLPLTEATREHYVQLLQQGYGDEDISALYRLKRPS